MGDFISNTCLVCASIYFCYYYRSQSELRQVFAYNELIKTCADPGIFARGFFEVPEGVKHFPGGGGSEC